MASKSTLAEITHHCTGVALGVTITSSGGCQERLATGSSFSKDEVAKRRHFLHALDRFTPSKGKLNLDMA